jgi:hypothetical protein
VGDSAFITLLALSGLLVGNVWAALAGAGALALDALLEPPNRREWPFVAVLLAAALVYSLLVAFPASGPDLPTVPLLATLTVSGLFLFAVFRYGQPAALSDARGEPLDPIRVKAAMLLTLGIALSATLWEGGVGLDETYVLWAAMAGVGLYGLVWMVRREE